MFWSSLSPNKNNSSDQFRYRHIFSVENHISPFRKFSHPSSGMANTLLLQTTFLWVCGNLSSFISLLNSWSNHFIPVFPPIQLCCISQDKIQNCVRPIWRTYCFRVNHLSSASTTGIVPLFHLLKCLYFKINVNDVTIIDPITWLNNTLNAFHSSHSISNWLQIEAEALSLKMLLNILFSRSMKIRFVCA